MNTFRKTNNWKRQSVKFFRGRQASFGQLGLIRVPQVDFQKSQNGLNDYNGPENIIYTIVKYGETFYGRNTALTPIVVKPFSYLNKMWKWPCLIQFLL